MRIVHVTDGYLPRLGGIELQVRDLAERQAAFGHDVEIVTATTEDDSVGARRQPRVLVHRPRTTATIGLREIRGLAERTVDGGFDLVHVHVSVVSPLAMYAVRRCVAAGIPIAVTVHSIWTPAAARVIATLVPRGAAASAAWSGVSTAVTRALALHAGIDAQVVPNGLEPEWWRLPSAPAALSNPAAPLRVVSAMRLTRRKRPLSLVDAVHLANARPHTSDRPIELTIVGSGRLGDRVKSRAGRAGDRSVSLPGRLDRTALRSLFAGHDVYVAPAKLESFGLAALEARSAGLPVVAWRRSGLADQLQHGRDALLVDSDRGFTDALRLLASRPEVLAALRVNCAEPPRLLGWSTTLAGYDELYEQATAACRRTAGRATGVGAR